MVTIDISIRLNLATSRLRSVGDVKFAKITNKINNFIILQIKM